MNNIIDTQKHVDIEKLNNPNFDFQPHCLSNDKNYSSPPVTLPVFVLVEEDKFL